MTRPTRTTKPAAKRKATKPAAASLADDAKRSLADAAKALDAMGKPWLGRIARGIIRHVDGLAPEEALRNANRLFGLEDDDAQRIIFHATEVATEAETAAAQLLELSEQTDALERSVQARAVEVVSDIMGSVERGFLNAGMRESLDRYYANPTVDSRKNPMAKMSPAQVDLANFVHVMELARLSGSLTSALEICRRADLAPRVTPVLTRDAINAWTQGPGRSKAGTPKKWEVLADVLKTLFGRTLVPETLRQACAQTEATSPFFRALRSARRTGAKV